MRMFFMLLMGLAAAFVSGHAFAAEGQTTGPHDEKPTPAASYTLTPAEEQKIRDGKFSAALVWHEMSEYTTAVNAGVKLGFVDNSPVGYVQGRDYVTIVSDDLFQMGHKAGVAMAAALGNKGKVGYIFHDADFYVTNQRDQAFKKTIEQDYPEMKIVAEQGMADPARAEEIAQAMVTQNPDLDGIYVTWAEPALSVLSTLRSAGNTHTRIVALDLNEPAALDMVKGGNVAALVADEAYNIGVTVARATAGSLVGKQAAPFLVVDSLAVTKDTVKEGWQKSLHRDVPASIAAALK